MVVKVVAVAASTCGGRYCTMRSTPEMSMPRAATSVATRTPKWPSRNWARVRSRCACEMRRGGERAVRSVVGVWGEGSCGEGMWRGGGREGVGAQARLRHVAVEGLRVVRRERRAHAELVALTLRPREHDRARRRAAEDRDHVGQRTDATGLGHRRQDSTVLDGVRRLGLAAADDVDGDRIVLVLARHLSGAGGTVSAGAEGRGRGKGRRRRRVRGWAPPA